MSEDAIQLANDCSSVDLIPYGLQKQVDPFLNGGNFRDKKGIVLPIALLQLSSDKFEVYKSPKHISNLTVSW